MIRVGHRVCRLAAYVTLVLAGQLFGPLHTALPTASRSAFPREQGQATVHISPSTAQNIALTEQRSHVTGHVCQAQILTAQQQMGDARVRGQLRHGFAVGCEFPVLASLCMQSAQPLQ